MEVSADDLGANDLNTARLEREDEYAKLASTNGSENPYQLQAELADLMWNNCGIWRKQADLLRTREALKTLTERAKNCGLVDAGSWTNQALPYTRSVQT